MVLGFLAEGPLHGYALRQKMDRLHGYARSVSFGTLYPAIARLTDQGLVRQEAAPGSAGAARRVLHLTDRGRLDLERRLRTVSGLDVTDGQRFMVVLAFLSLLPDASARDDVLRRRLAFLDQPAGFFSDGPLPDADIADPYRRGVLVSARATSRAERAWLRGMLAVPPAPAASLSDPTPDASAGAQRGRRKPG